jgi:Na+/melibiose symporter-like transporter
MNGKSVWTTTGASVCCFAVRERAVGHQKKEGEEKGKGSISLETHKQIETSTTQELLFFFCLFLFLDSARFHRPTILFLFFFQLERSPPLQ